MSRDVDVAGVLTGADEVKRTLRLRVTAALDGLPGKDAAADSAAAAMQVLRGLDPETLRRAALAFLVRLAADDARHQQGLPVGLPKKVRPKSNAPSGGRQNLRAPMPKQTIFAGENFPVSNPRARYDEIMARQRAAAAAAKAREAAADE